MSNNTADDENDLIGHICHTGDQIPIEGYWEPIGSGDPIWHELEDKQFNTYLGKGADFKYLGKKKP